MELLCMKTPTVVRNGVSTEMVDLVGRLVELIAWPARRRAMGDGNGAARWQAARGRECVWLVLRSIISASVVSNK